MPLTRPQRIGVNKMCTKCNIDPDIAQRIFNRIYWEIIRRSFKVLK